VSTVVKDSTSKDTIHEGERTVPLKTRQTSGTVAMVRYMGRLTLSQNYQSIAVEVGGDMPYPCAPGDKEAFKAGVKEFKEVCEELLMSEVKDMKELLRNLGR